MPIEFLDDNIKETKNKLEIEFIDLPGFNNNGQNFDIFFRNLINFTELFLFINDKNVIQDENKDLIQEFFEILLSEKNKFNLDSIMFVVNQIDLSFLKLYMIKYKISLFYLLLLFKHSKINRWNSKHK